ncbi:hypothetical protein CoNPh25_CDS0004 [Staphylococcus phage S-CoN_Ph25]|nr:hypothetical protein CoNPh25_CDS0004 [Staphylococcus phage S-CoN_Ph25]
MKKFLYAFVVILLFVVGLIGLFYGLFILWQAISLYCWWIATHRSLRCFKSSV